MTDTATRDVTAEVTAWLEENWDPDLTVGEWWERLGLAGWAAPTWPEQWFGRGLSRDEANAVSREINAYGALGIAVAETLALPGRDLVRVLMAQRRVIEALGRVGHRHLSGALPGSHGVVGAGRASLQSNQNDQSECIAAHGSLL